MFTGELALNSGTLGVELDGTKAPQAAAVFKSLSDEGYFTGKTCHRLTTGESFGVLQCGSPIGEGRRRPELHVGSAGKHPG